jgi:hypothetical protein
LAWGRFSLSTRSGCHERTKRFRAADFARNRTSARGNFRRPKDRLVLVGRSRREIFIICRIGAVDRQDGLPNPIRARFVDHVQRINRRVPYWMRLSDTITSGKRRARNGGGTLYQRSTRRRLAQGGTLLDRLHGLSLSRSGQIFCGSSSPAQEIPRAKS